MKQVADGKVKITPDVLVQGGTDSGGNNMLSAFIASLMTGGLKLIKDPDARPEKPGKDA